MGPSFGILLQIFLNMYSSRIIVSLVFILLLMMIKLLVVLERTGGDTLILSITLHFVPVPVVESLKTLMAVMMNDSGLQRHAPYVSLPYPSIATIE